MVPLVSVIVPCFNAAPWLAEALGSCFAQTHPRIEVVLVDNGSTDESLKIARQFRDSRLLIVTCDKRGAGASRNVGLQHAKGEFIQYLDADDLLSADKIQGQLEALSRCRPGTLGLCKAIYFLDGEGREPVMVQDGWPLVNAENPADWLVELLGPEQGSMVPLGCWLTPATTAREAGPWDERLSVMDDGEYFARVVLTAKGIRRSENGCYCYRKHRKGSNLSAQRAPAHWRSAILATDLIKSNLLKRRNDARAKKALARLYMDIAHVSYPEARAESKTAIGRVKSLGGSDYRPAFGTRWGKAAGRLVGWRAIRLASYAFHAAKRRLYD